MISMKPGKKVVVTRAEDGTIFTIDKIDGGQAHLSYIDNNNVTQHGGIVPLSILMIPTNTQWNNHNGWNDEE